MATPMQLLSQLRALSTEDLRRDTALRQPTGVRETSEPGRATASDTLRDVVTELQSELTTLTDYLDEWESAESNDERADARASAAEAASNVLHELARLGAVAPGAETVRESVQRVHARVRRHPALKHLTTGEGEQLVAAVLTVIGYVEPLPNLTEPLQVVPAKG